MIISAVHFGAVKNQTGRCFKALIREIAGAPRLFCRR